MNTIRRLGILWLITAITLSFAACSSDDDPVIEEEEETFIEGKLPSNIHVGMIYPISHDKKNDKCTFGLYLGENPPQDLIEAMEKEYVYLKMYDRYGQPFKYKFDGFKFDPETGTYKDGFNTWDTEKKRGEFRHDNTFTISCSHCEIITKFVINYNGPALFNYYPELEQLDDVEIYLTTTPVAGEFFGGSIIQSWSSPHHWYF
jgi:hypothetical protein